MKNSAKILAILGMLYSLYGCSNIKQSSRITFVTALGIDKNGDGVTVHALAAIPGDYSELTPGGAAQTKEAPNYILTQSGKNVSDAIYKMKRKTARDIQFGHTKIILFSDELAKAGINPSLDIFMRREEFQSIAWLGYTKGDTKAVLEISPKVPETISDVLTDVFSQSGSDTFEILPIYLYKFYSLSVEPGQTAFIPIVNGTKEGNKIEISGLALFTKDKMVGELSPKETKILQFLQKQHLRQTSIILPEGSLNVLNFRTKIHMDKDKIAIQIKLEVEMDQSSVDNITTSAKKEEIEADANKDVQDQTERLIKKLQLLKTDPVGFGNIYRIKVNGGFLDMEEWLASQFPKMEIQVKVQTNIVHRGIIQ